jgi:hypothetical protein
LKGIIWGGVKLYTMAKRFETVIKILFDYYGDFMEDPRIAKLMENARGTVSPFPGETAPLSDDQLEDVAAAMGRSGTAAMFRNTKEDADGKE